MGVRADCEWWLRHFTGGFAPQQVRIHPAQATPRRVASAASLRSVGKEEEEV